MTVKRTWIIARGGHHAPPGNILLIGTTRPEKICNKQFAMSTSQQNDPHIGFMQNSAAILEKSIFHYISANITDNWQNKMYRQTLVMRVIDHNKTIVDIIICVYDSLICKLVPPLLRNLFFSISRPILHINRIIRCPATGKQQSWI